ncbi:MAG TPA: CocE/NonD family hydrolase [Candidatus Acidoferrum sp.]|nr:CocE/NonD family hydrolase [Candidatus Acidoferrum sp.]
MADLCGGADWRWGPSRKTLGVPVHLAPMTLAANRFSLRPGDARRGGRPCSFATFLAVVLIALMPTACRRPQKPTLVVTELRVPTSDSDYRGLEAVMVRPDDNAPHPLALMTHGTWGGPAERSQSTPLRFIPQAREFARRGWTVVIVMRRGFGDSGGIYMEDAEECSQSPNPAWSTEQAAKDLREAATYLAARPEVDGSRMIGVGLSTGGLAILGLSADPPSGLKAVINFAGGRGSDGKDHVCNPDALVRTFGDLGKRSRVPTLWLYAANDHFFGPQLAQQFYQAFLDNGGNVRFIATGPFGADGHELFSQQGAPIWTPLVDEFLLSQNLVLRDALLPDPLPDVATPSHLGRDARKQFEAYLLNAPHKAFATSRSGAFGFSYGQRTTAAAEGKALANCNKFASGDITCAIAVIDDATAPN